MWVSDAEGNPIQIVRTSSVMTSGREVKGTVAQGRGLGAPRMADPAILARMRQLAGFALVPGTLNVELPQPLERGVLSQYLAAAELDRRGKARPDRPATSSPRCWSPVGSAASPSGPTNLYIPPI